MWKVSICEMVRNIGRKEGFAAAREKAAGIAKVSADYYAKGTKREDGTLNTTVASAAQTSWDIFKAIEAMEADK